VSPATWACTCQTQARSVLAPSSKRPRPAPLHASSQPLPFSSANWLQLSARLVCSAFIQYCPSSALLHQVACNWERHPPFGEIMHAAPPRQYMFELNGHVPACISFTVHFTVLRHQPSVRLCFTTQFTSQPPMQPNDDFERNPCCHAGHASLYMLADVCT
jgi:hypothetical protein